MQAKVDSIPSANNITKQLEKLDAVVPMINCLADFGVAFADVVSYIITLELDIASMASSTNTTLMPTINGMKNSTTQMTKQTASKDALNITSYLASIDKMNETTQNAIKTMNNLSFVKDMDAANKTVMNTGVTSAATALDAVLVANALSQSFITALAAFGVAVNSFKTTLATGSAELAMYTQGYCNGATGTLCAANGDCGPNGPCIGYNTNRCRADGATACGACGGADTCVVNTIMWGTIAAGLANNAAPTAVSTQVWRRRHPLPIRANVPLMCLRIPRSTTS